jgi:hypothetical protein
MGEKADLYPIQHRSRSGIQNQGDDGCRMRFAICHADIYPDKHGNRNSDRYGKPDLYSRRYHVRQQ